MVGIICFWDRLATPYLQKYEKILANIDIPYEIVFWNRIDAGSSAIEYGTNEVVISSVCRRKTALKIRDFIRWRRLVLEVIRHQKYDRLIVLTTVPAVLIFRSLLGKYKEKFIFDIRDYTLERFSVFQKMVMRIIRASQMTAISSKGYMKWLDDDPKIKVNHNITVEKALGKACQLKEKRPIRFAFVGNVRLDTQTEALLRAMGKRNEFEQHFYGRVLKECTIEKIANELSITNVYMHGAFSVEDKKQFFNEIDLLNAVYANCEKDEDIPLGDSTPLPNRLYDALVFKKPLVASRGTYLAELIKTYNIGCVVNGFDVDAVDKIIQYVDSFDEMEFEKGAERLLEIVRQEEASYIAELTKILLGWKQ